MCSLLSNTVDKRQKHTEDVAMLRLALRIRLLVPLGSSSGLGANPGLCNPAPARDAMPSPWLKMSVHARKGVLGCLAALLLVIRRQHDCHQRPRRPTSTCQPAYRTISIFVSGARNRRSIVDKRPKRPVRPPTPQTIKPWRRRGGAKTASSRGLQRPKFGPPQGRANGPQGW